VKRVAPAVVNVYATARIQARSPFEGDPFFERFFGGGAPRERERSSLGSGVIVDPHGLIITNNHVISGASEVKVALADGREYQAEILLRDEPTDLAALKIQNGDEEFPALGFGDSDNLEVGDLVLAVGNPFGVGQTVTSGIVSAVSRTNLGINDSGFFIQTDAAINPGNSGGALVDMEGAVVGINTAIYSRSGGSIGIGFAVPSNMVRQIATQALAGSTSVVRPWIGVAAQEVTPEIAASLGLSAPSRRARDASRCGLARREGRYSGRAISSSAPPGAMWRTQPASTTAWPSLASATRSRCRSGGTARRWKSLSCRRPRRSSTRPI
jgi:S1-C subfamily serine protease